MSPLGAKRSQLLRWTEAIGATPVVVASLSPQVSSVPVFRETAVIPSFRRADPHIAHFETFLREDLDGTHSLLLVLGSWRPSQGSFRWSPGDTVGLFLIKNSDPDFVWELAIASSHDDFALEVECANFSSVVWSSTIGMYGTPSDSIKTPFDTSSKGVLRQFEFAPLGVRQILSHEDSLFFSLNSLDYPYSPWPEAPVARLVGNEPVVVTGAETKGMLALFREASITDIERYRHGLADLPQSSFDEFVRKRPDGALRGKDSYRYEIVEGIGPSQTVDDRLWFGKTFYDGEGLSRVGGFGNFDPEEKRYVEFSPPEIWRWSASALLIEDDFVWVGRVLRPEGHEHSGGLLRYELESGKVSEFRVGKVIRQIKRWGGKLYMATDGGLYVLEDSGRIERYVFEPSLGGGAAAFHCES